jgi:glycerate kinase
MAAASGLVLVPPARRDPLRTTTYGTGELLLAAFDAGCREIVIGLGGSATVDGGLGFAQALGARLFDGRGRVLPAPATGRELAAVASIDFSRLDRRIAASSIRAACDVTNPLCGPRGAARVYGPQKGATAAQVRRLERGLVRLGAIFRRKTGRSVAAMAGSGAAGGLGAALVAVAGARLVRGADLIFSETGVPALMDWADLVLTGEGNADAQSVQGKTVGALAHLARVRRRTLAVLAGGLGPGAEKLLDAGATELIAVGDPRLSAKQNLARTRDNLSRAAADVAACFAKNGGLT